MINKNLILGKNVKIQENVSIGEFPEDFEGKVEIGDNSLIRSGTIIYKNVKIGKISKQQLLLTAM